ncbi:MAG: hypothetical protein C0592_00620 [Marinilabiliales bacterium]|nr:MAG: hypothetical protein C0592_00620 [Marinilabiliales bacterium]
MKVMQMGFQNSLLGMRASALSFKFLLAAIPGLIVLNLTLPTILPSGTRHLLFQMLSEFLPRQIFGSVAQPISSAAGYTANNGILSVIAIASLYFAVNGMRASMQIFNQTYHIRESRPLWRQFGVALLMVISSMIIIGAAMLVFLFNQYVMSWLEQENILSGYWSSNMFQITKWFVFYMVLLLFLSMLYFLAPSRKSRLRIFTPGTLLAALLALLAFMGFDQFIKHYSNYQVVYGGISALFILMLFLFIIANIFLGGFEINAAIYFGGKDKQKYPGLDIKEENENK